MTDPTTPPAAAPRWWREREFWLVVVGVAAVFFPRIGALPLRGEEPRRAQVAAEMAHFGDWAVPREQGEPFLSRPPLHNWLIAASEAAFGVRETWVPRVPSVLAVILTAAVLYGYSRRFLSPLGALAAAVAYPSMGEVLQQGREAETEAVYVFFLSASLLLWHWGYTARWRPSLTWAAGYVMWACAGLCKGGLQPSVYFAGTVGLYLLWNRDLRFLFTRGHAVGLLAGAGVLAAWAVPCAARIGWPLTLAMWIWDAAARTQGWAVPDVLRHLVRFPLEVIGCTLPWCLLPLAYLGAARRRELAAVGGCVPFCAVALFVAVPSVWIPPDGQTRYLTPLYPCLAVLAGVVVDRVAADPGRFAAGWRAFLRTLGVTFAGFAVAAVLMGLGGSRFEEVSIAPGRGLLYAAALAALAGGAWALSRDASAGGVRGGVLAAAAGVAVVCTGLMTDVRVNRGNDIADGVARVKAKVAAGERYVSLGPVPASIQYYLGQVIPARPLPVAEDAVPPGGYFCFMTHFGNRPDVPFAWEPVEEVSVVRHRTPNPEVTVVVGRRAGGASGVARR